MGHNKETKIVDDLVDLAEWKKHNEFERGVVRKSFGMVEPVLTFMGAESVRQFENLTDQLFKLNKQVADTYTIEKFIAKLILLIRDLKTDSRKCSASEYEEIISAMLAIPIEEFEIFYDLYGAEMDNNEIDFGDFKIYHFERSLPTLIEKYPYLQNRKVTFTERKSDLVLGIKTKARTQDKAAEIANRFCSQFENVFSYVTGDLTHVRSVGIFNFRGWTTTEVTVCGSDTYGGQTITQIWLPVNIENTFFKKESIGNDKIWGLITEGNKSEIERRVLTAMEWIGKGVYEKDTSKALVQFVFAIESMLQFNEGNFVTPSIVSQIGDWLAFIIEDEKDRRIKVATYFRDTYKKRSGIAHGGDISITVDDLHIAFQLAKAMVVSFLVRKPFCDMRTMKDLNAHMTNLKFQ